MSKDIFKLVLWYVCSFIITVASTLILGVSSHHIFSPLLQGFSTMVTVAAAMSFVFFTYTDNIEQKLSDLYKKFNEVRIDQAHASIGALKREIILNGICVLCMALLEKLISGVDLERYQIIIGSHKIEASHAGIASRLSLFILGVLVLIDQVKAFLTAIKFRPVISKGSSR